MLRHNGLERVGIGAEGQVADVQFGSLRRLGLLFTSLLLCVCVTDPNPSAVDLRLIERCDRGIGRFLGFVGHEAKSTRGPRIVGHHNTIGHLTVGTEEFPELVGIDTPIQAANEQPAAGRMGRSLSATSSSTAPSVRFEPRILTGSAVFSNVLRKETGPSSGALREEGFRSAGPSLSASVQFRGPFASAVAVREGSERSLVAGRTVKVPITVLFRVKVTSAMLAQGVKNTVLWVLPHVGAKDWVHGGHRQPAHVPSAKAVADLMEEAVHNVGHAELRPKLGGHRNLALAFDREDNELCVLLLYLIDGGDDPVADFDVDDLRRCQNTDHTVNFASQTNNSRDQIVALNGNAWSSSVVWVVPDLRAGGDEARRHGITSCVTEGSAMLPLAASFSMRLLASTAHEAATDGFR